MLDSLIILYFLKILMSIMTTLLILCILVCAQFHPYSAKLKWLQVTHMFIIMSTTDLVCVAAAAIVQFRPPGDSNRTQRKASQL